MKGTASALGCALALLSIARAGVDADTAINVLAQTKIGTNKFALKGLKFKTTETGKVRVGQLGQLELHIGGNMIVHFEKAETKERRSMFVSGHVTNDNIGFRMPKVQIVLGTASYLKGEILPRKSFASDEKGKFDIEIEPKEGEVLYFVFEGWPIEEYAVSELLAESKG